jgi:acyl carrier protein
LEQQAFLALAADILELDESQVSLDSNLDDIDWDSLANISFIAEVDSLLNRSVSPEKLNKCETLANIFALISD